MWQLLCKRKPKGRLAVHENLLKHDALNNTIRSGKISAVRGIIESSVAKGTRLMDSTIMHAYQEGKISGSEAYMKASDKD